MKNFIIKISIIIILIGYVSNLKAQIESEPYIKWKEYNKLPKSISLIDIQFFNADTGYAWGSCLYKTFNRGKSWELVSDFAKGSRDYYLISWKNSDIAWGATSAGSNNSSIVVLYTMNSGLNWDTLCNYYFPNAILEGIQFIDSNFGWLRGFNNVTGTYFILKTEDGGKNWDKQDLLSSIKSIMDLCFINDSIGYACGRNEIKGAVFMTKDGGKEWNVLNTTNQTLYSLFVNDSLNIWVCGSNGALLNTTDGGKNWKFILTNTFSTLSDISFINSNDGLIMGSEGVKLITTNGGKNWTKKDSIQTIRAPFCRTIDEIWGISNSIIFHSTDTANHWDHQPINSMKYLNEVEFYNTNNGWIIGNMGKVLHTNNGGKNWEAQLIPTINNLNDLSIINDSVCWIVGDYGEIFSTVDYGENWRKKTLEISYNINSVDFVNSKIGWIACDSGNIKKTNNGGNTWINQITGIYNDIKSIFFIDSLTGWAVGSNSTILYTDNGGETWYSKNNPGTSTTILNKVFFSDLNCGYAIGFDNYIDYDYEQYKGGVLLKTLDGGQTWLSLINSNDRMPMFNDVYFQNKDTGWIVGHQYNFNVIFKSNFSDNILFTENGGNSWRAQFNNLPYEALLEGVFVTDSGGWAVGGDQYEQQGMMMQKISSCRNVYIDKQLLCKKNINQSYSWINGKHYYSSNNSALVYLEGNASNGCDSLIKLDLTVLYDTYANIEAITCEEYLSPSGKYVWRKSGQYLDTILNNSGCCDSIITVNLTIKNTLDTITVSSCDNYISPSSKYTWESSGIYYDTLLNTNGCDSIIIIDLNINCSNSILRNEILQVSLYPNPTSSKIFIEFNELNPEIYIELFSIAGKLVLSERYFNTKEIIIDFKEKKGIYLLKIYNNKGKITNLKIIKQ